MRRKWFDWEAMLWIGLGSYILWREFSAIARLQPILAVFGSLAIVLGIALWRRVRWARRALSGLCAVATLSSGWMILAHGFSLSRALALACCGWGVYTYWTKPEDDADDENEEETVPSERAKDKPDRPCFALLLSGPRYEQLSTECLTQVIEETFGVKLGNGGEKSTEYVVGSDLMYMAQFGGRVWMISHVPTPYFEDPKVVAGSLNELRVDHAVRQHKAFLSISLMHEYEGSDEKECYRILGKLTAALAAPVEFIDPSSGAPVAPWPPALAVFWPAGEQVRVYDEAVDERLRGDDPLSAFREPTVWSNPPVMKIDDDDPRYQAAVDEARRRWPEFLAAFTAKAGRTFTVKAAFSEGAMREFMWISVDRIDGDCIVGRLGNEPVRLKQLQIGDPCTIALAEMVDWIFEDDRDLQGGFTLNALGKIRGWPPPE